MNGIALFVRESFTFRSVFFFLGIFSVFTFGFVALSPLLQFYHYLFISNNLIGYLLNGLYESVITKILCGVCIILLL